MATGQNGGGKPMNAGPMMAAQPWSSGTPFPWQQNIQQVGPGQWQGGVGTPASTPPGVTWQGQASDGGVIGGTPPPAKSWRAPLFSAAPFGMMMPQMQQPTQMPGWQQQFPGATPQAPTPQGAAALYLQQNPDVATAGMDPWEHYNRYGQTEGRTWTGPAGGAVPARPPAPAAPAATQPAAAAPASSSGTRTVAPGTTPPAGLQATTMVGGTPMQTAYQMVGDQAVAVDPLLDYYLSLAGGGA